MKKVITGIIVGIPFLIVVYFYNPHYLFSFKFVTVYLLGIFASYFQADYHPFKINNIKEDKGTVLQIIWSVYLTQMMAIAEVFFFKPQNLFLISPLYLTYLVIAIIFLVFRAWAYLTLGKFFTMHLETQSDHQLIENGPYRFLRHPSYTGAYLSYIFQPLFLGAPISALATLIILFLAFYRRITLEEKMLLNKLGPAYEKFCSTRYRLIPYLW